MGKDTNSPDWRDPDNLEMGIQSTIMRDVTMGTLHIQSKGETYLPKYFQESKSDYNARLKNSELIPATAEAITTMVGKILSKPTQLNEIDEEKFYIENIDNTGTTFESFEADSLRKALRDGMGFVLVDFPAVEGRSRAQERADNIKPYFKYIKNTQVLNKRSKIVNGVTVLEQVTIEDMKTVEDGDFGTRDVTQYRVYRLRESIVSVEVYEETEEGVVSVEEERALKGVKEIPLVPLYTNQTGFMVATPLLAEMAQINLSVYRMNSGLKRTIYNVGDPTNVIYGDAPRDDQGNPLPIVVGSSNMLQLDRDAKYEIVGISPEIIAPTKEEIESMKKDMAKIATEMINTEADRTATEVSKDDANQKSKLKQIAINLENCWNKCKEFYYGFLGEMDEGEIIVNRDFNSTAMSAEDRRELRADWQAGVITHKTYIEELQKGELLTTVEDVEAEIAEAENEMQNKLPFGEIVNNDGYTQPSN